MIATQKWGVAMPSTAKNLPTRSSQVSRFIADKMPKGKPTTIVSAMAAIETKYNGRIPHERQELEGLPGIGRKTANVILYNAFGKPAIAVDTHVLRLSARLGLSKEKTPEKVERDLMKLLPAKDWGLSSHLLISHGRNVCTARQPRCAACSLYSRCPRIGVN
jgi:endonuclease-3